MAAVTSLIMGGVAIAGLGMQAYGYAQQKEGAAAAAAGAKVQSIGAQVQAKGSEMQAEGAGIQVQGAGLQNQATKEITKLEFQTEEQRMKAMELDARRTQLEIIRNQQRARALGLTSASAQGAQYGSGLQGGYGQISGQTTSNILGIQQNLQIGRDLFAINSGISQQRLRYAEGGDVINQGAGKIAQGSGIIAQGQGIIGQGQGQINAAQGTIAAGQGLSSLGGSLVNASATVGNLGGSAWNALKPMSNPWSGGMYNYKSGSIGGIY